MSAINSNLITNESRKSWASLLELAAGEVFERMLGSHLTPGPESFDEQGLAITSMVGLAGQICGVLTLRCTANSAVLMASKMLGVDAEQAGPEMPDAVGEVCNMIAGNFKNKIAGMGDGCMLSVPTVITGADYSLHALTDSGKIEIHLLFEGLPLIIAIEVHS
ncbi:MAG TPA: chemotaxis protein CheX [Terriglobales bacterium]|nr:chemotaxis protein CheX [Terriglobales bacterium]